MPISDSQPILFALPQQPITTAIEPGIDSSDFATSSVNTNNVSASKLKTSPKALKLPFSEQNVARLQYPENNISLPAAQPSPITPVVMANTKIETAPQSETSKSVILTSHSVSEWIWPTTGKLLSSFSKNSKGVKISGQAGQPILASAAGEVVYSGHGLRGYGNLIIIKHNNTFLSAYAHNSKLLVKEGEAVAKGQKIAEMGNTDTDMTQLHFEIRKHGKPVDPLEYLPNQS
jgi:lipoprotein NlpD